MYRVLFMPFLRIPSGHHHVADCLERQLSEASNQFQCEKVEILSYCYGKVETFISATYLRWIEKLPKLYSMVYRWTVNKQKVNRRYYLYELLFLRQIRKLLIERKPHLVICTHALPSYLLNILKRKGLWSGKIINVYTDYYINDLWGTSVIDYHFMPSSDIKRELMEKGISEEKILVSGIPVDPIFKMKSEKEKIVVSGKS